MKESDSDAIRADDEFSKYDKVLTAKIKNM